METEVCVIGGGPAGCLAACRLAELGHRTLLIDRSPDTAPPRAESLPPGFAALPAPAGWADAVAGAVFAVESEALLRWRSAGTEIKRLEPPGRLVERQRLDRQLRALAYAHGVQLLTPARAQALERTPGGGWRVRVAGASGEQTLEAAYLVDARGRRPAPARGTRGAAPATVALRASWQAAPGAGAGTRIESGAAAWYWGSPLPGGRYAGTVFVDAAVAAGLNRERRRRCFARLLADSQLIGPLLDLQTLGPVTVQDATSRIAGLLIDTDLVRIGDAACAIDPLSSQGLQRAMVSAWQGAAAVHTILSGRDPAPALRFYRERQTEAWQQAQRHAARLYAEGGPANRAFWAERSATASAPAEAPYPPASPAPLPARVRPCSQLRRVDTPVLAGDTIEMAQAVEHPRLSRPCAYVGHLALASLIEDVETEPSCERLVSAWAQRMPRDQAAGALAWLWSRGLLVEAA